MRIAAPLLLILAAGMPAGAMAAPLSEAEMAVAVQGCWNRVNWPERPAGSDAYASLQICLAGGVTGSADYVECIGAAVIECRQIAARYAFRDAKLWFDYGSEGVDGTLSNCDVTVGPGRRLSLLDCQWVVPTEFSTPIDDMVFEKAAAS